MYLFSRQTRLTSQGGVEWATRIGAKVAEVTGQPVELWGTVYGPGFGTVSWTSWFADLPSLEAFGDKIQLDPGFQALAAEGAEHTTGLFDDGLVQVIAGEVDPSRELQYVSGAQAVCAAGNLARAMTAGVEIAQKAEAATGLPTLFARSLTGPYGGIGWLTGYTSIAELETANDAIAANADFMATIDATEGAFVEDASITQQTLYRKLA